MATNIVQTIVQDVSNLVDGRHQAIAGPPVFGNSDPGRYDFHVEVPLWGVTWLLHGYTDAKLAMNATFSIRLPFVGTTQLANLKGNLADGITLIFDIKILSNGKAKFYISDKWLYLNLSATVYGKAHGPTAFGLFPLPLGARLQP
ncbi:hypothetical protein C8J57DRAFT_1308669 [Mycena rebaudengoi]|nr:hypothetical protein C8J57DRAFT_1308669 [Mycena rebaudengoi]